MNVATKHALWYEADTKHALWCEADWGVAECVRSGKIKPKSRMPHDVRLADGSCGMREKRQNQAQVQNASMPPRMETLRPLEVLILI